MDERIESGPEPVDIAVGNRIKVRRNELGLSQERLGEALGITFQQVQKYERGTNRVSASRLSQIARALRVPVGYFFNEHGTRVADVGMSEDRRGFDPQLDDILQRRETLDLVRAYWRIPTKAARRSVYDLVRSLAAPDAPPDPAPDAAQDPAQDPAPDAAPGAAQDPESGGGARLVPPPPSFDAG